MKNLYLMAALLVCSMGIAQNRTATKSSSNPVKFGLKLGVNIAKLTDSEGENMTTTPRTGINAGFYVNCKFADAFAFQPELLYTTQGINQKGFYGGTEVKTKYKFDYIAVPLMIKYYPNKNFNIEFGPQLGFMVNKEIEGKVFGETRSYDLDDFFKANGVKAKTNTFDFSLNFGVGTELENGLNFGARYSLGMTKVFEGRDITDIYGKPSDVRNSVFTFSMGYSFN
ncbi:MAG: porin family protein [Flavobacterium sp.]